MDLSKLSVAHKTVLGGAVVLLVAAFMPWHPGVMGWASGFPGVLGILVVMAGAAAVLLKAYGVYDVHSGELVGEQVGVVLAGLGAILVTFELFFAGLPASYGLVVGIIGAALATWGAWQAMREAGLELPVDDTAS